LLCLTLSTPLLAKTKQEPWPEITPAEKALNAVPGDPGEDIVVLNNERHGKILHHADDWVNQLHYHWRAKILTEEGKRFNEVTLRELKFSRISNLQARTIKPDGSIVEVRQDQMFERVTNQWGNIKVSEWVFAFPAMEPGAIIEYRYDRHDDFLIYIDPFYFEGPGYTLRAEVTQAIPEEMGYQILCSRCPPGTQPSINKWREGPAKGKMYEVMLHDLPGYHGGMMMPPRGEISPRLEMNLHTWKGYYMDALGRLDEFFNDWSSVARYVGYYYAKAGEDGQTELRHLVGGWLEGITDRQETIAAIVRHVRNDLRLIPWATTIGRTRTLDKILQDMSADNEEKAVVLQAALKVAGIDSHVALVAGRDHGILNPEFFSLSQFTHAVVAIPNADGGLQWIDPTVSYAPLDYVPWQDSEASALIIRGLEGELVELPRNADTGKTRYKVAVTPHLDGRAELDIEAEYEGQDAVEMRQRLAPVGEKEREEFLADWLHKRLPGATLVTQSIEKLQDLEEPLELNLKATASGVVTVADNAVLVKGNLLSGYESNPIGNANREHDLCVDRGWNQGETVVIAPPEGMEAGEVPPTASANAGVARISFRCYTNMEGAVECSRVFGAPRKRWPPSRFESLRKLMDRLVEVDSTVIAFHAKTEPAQANEP